MTAQASLSAKFPNSERSQGGRSQGKRSQGLQDVLLVSSFGVWAALLGLMPVMAFRLLAGS
jgi:hypothetical protein